MCPRSGEIVALLNCDDYFDHGIVAAFATRSGGVSRGHFAGANISFSVGDDPAAVRANRAGVLGAAGLTGLPVVTLRQVHGGRCVPVGPAGPEAPDPGGSRARSGTLLPAGDRLPEGDPLPVPGLPAGDRLSAPPLAAADAMVTRTPGIALMIGTADCLPVLLADPVARCVGALHVGWRGLLAGVVEAGVAALLAMGAVSGRTAAWLGPSICSRCYPAGRERRRAMARRYPEAVTEAGTFDLLAGVTAVLARAGVHRVRAVGGCTREDPERWFSRRRDGRTGAHAALVALLR
ncbi:polyphenol oxidase family protein [Planobispora rosea]|uniref:polyphenol oxidase family protein n=1 Tax=Planobispora rosea TaxID=35762 RepID=UPI001E2C1A32|nr:polyphenol oxidase family protein [Planobispora rosea]